MELKAAQAQAEQRLNTLQSVHDAEMKQHATTRAALSKAELDHELALNKGNDLSVQLTAALFNVIRLEALQKIWEGEKKEWEATLEAHLQASRAAAATKAAAAAATTDKPGESVAVPEQQVNAEAVPNSPVNPPLPDGTLQPSTPDFPGTESPNAKRARLEARPAA